MLKLNAHNLELRGIQNKTSNNGNVYYYANLETPEGEAQKFFVPKAECFESGLKKGDKVNVEFNYYVYDDKPRFTVVSIKKEVR